MGGGGSGMIGAQRTRVFRPPQIVQWMKKNYSISSLNFGGTLTVSHACLMCRPCHYCVLLIVSSKSWRKSNIYKSLAIVYDMERQLIAML